MSTSPRGVILEVDESQSGLEYGSVELLDDGIHYLHARVSSTDPSTLALGSSARLTPFDDPDDGRTIRAGENVAGVIDYHFDLDWYFVDLVEGDTVVVWTDAIATDTSHLLWDCLLTTYDQWVSDDNSGSSLFGDSTNAELFYTAPTSGEYVIVVEDAVFAAGGGYVLGVDQIN